MNKKQIAFRIRYPISLLSKTSGVHGPLLNRTGGFRNFFSDSVRLRLQEIFRRFGSVPVLEMNLTVHGSVWFESKFLKIGELEKISISELKY